MLNQRDGNCKDPSLPPYYPFLYSFLFVIFNKNLTEHFIMSLVIILNEIVNI